ncbi:MAG: DUF3256 family protein [Bacteroides sp.]|nr:DUF3256 family protein [Bacteroides sp.]
MKRLILLISLFISISLQAQNMKELFVAMPDTLVPLLTKVNREDFGDFLASKMKAEVRNRFGKTSEMTELTDDYLYLKMTSASSMEMKLLPLNDSLKVVCVIQTYQAPVADSKVRFYDTGWNLLETSRFIDLPVDSLFFRTPVTKAQADSLQNLRTHTDISLQEARLSAGEQTLLFRYTTPDYLDKATSTSLQTYLVQKPLRYVWVDGRFVRSKDSE